MANPNIAALSNIYGKTVFDADIATSASAIVTNAASSGKILKINSLIIANIDGSNNADITATIKNAAGNSISSTIANTVSVPADATLVLISKDTSIYLEEDMSIHLASSAAGDLSGTCSYDEIS
tara:strand:- start:1489 stop:1860 length:372 start_codon:yes stop_codon:yes gene_type:complete